jgi:hypothetical protein
VNREIGATLGYFSLELLYEQSLSADRGERPAISVARRRDGLHDDFETGLDPAKKINDDVRLLQREL